MKRIVLAIALAACGGGDGKTDAPGDTGPSADAKPDVLSGFIEVIQSQQDSVDTTVTLASFGFSYGKATERDDGPCHISIAPDDATGGSASAGAVVLSHDSERVEIDPGAGGGYSADVVHELRFAAGDLVDVAVMGAEVPHFTASVRFPADVTVSDPAGMTDVSKSGFSAAWSSTADAVHILLAQQNVNVDCSYAGSAGSGAIPASALADLTVGGPVGIVVTSNERLDTSAGPYAIEVVLAAYGIQTSGTVAQ